MDGKMQIKRISAPRLTKFMAWLSVYIVAALLPLYSSVYAQDETPPTVINDFDSDGITNTADVDDDNDGIPDVYEIAE